MKKLILFLLLIITAQLSKSQDLIVTTNNDSLNCQIVEKKGAFVIYKIKVDGTYQSRAVKNEFVLKTEVGYFLINNTNKSNLGKVEKIKKYNEGIFMVIGFNKSQLLNIYDYANTPSELKDYAKDLSNSISFNLEAEGYISKKFTLGLRYELYKSDAQKNNFATPGPSNTYYFDLEEDMIIHSISPKLSFKNSINGDNNIIAISGMIDYNIFNNVFSVEEDVSGITSSGDITGQKIGLSFGASFERVINNNLKVGITGLYKTCSISEVKINGVEETLSGKSQININRLNIGLYLVFR